MRPLPNAVRYVQERQFLLRQLSQNTDLSAGRSSAGPHGPGMGLHASPGFGNQHDPDLAGVASRLGE